MANDPLTQESGGILAELTPIAETPDSEAVDQQIAPTAAAWIPGIEPVIAFVTAGIDLAKHRYEVGSLLHEASWITTRYPSWSS